MLALAWQYPLFGLANIGKLLFWGGVVLGGLVLFVCCGLCCHRVRAAHALALCVVCDRVPVRMLRAIAPTTPSACARSCLLVPM